MRCAHVVHAKAVFIAAVAIIMPWMSCAQDAPIQIPAQTSEPPPSPPQPLDCAVADGYFDGYATFPKLRHALQHGDAIRIVVVGGASALGRAAGDNEKSWPARLIAYLTHAFPAASITLINKSVARSTAHDFIQRFDSEIARLAPNMVIWETGVSDSVRGTNLEDFRRSLHSGIKRMRAIVPESFLMDMQYGRTNDFLSNTNRYLNVMHNVADQSGMTLFPRNDMMRAWAEAGQFNYDVKGQEERRALATKLYDCLGFNIARFIIRPEKDLPSQDQPK
jgi:lysophospholipase L1-like esterase